MFKAYNYWIFQFFATWLFISFITDKMLKKCIMSIILLGSIDIRR